MVEKWHAQRDPKGLAITDTTLPQPSAHGTRPQSSVNMQHTWIWVPHLLISFIFLPTSSGIQCYYCTTETDSRCGDTSLFYSQTLTDQPSECTQQAVDQTISRVRKDIASPDGEIGNYDCIKIEMLNRKSANPYNTTVIRGCAQGQTRKFDPCNHLKEHFMSQGDMIHCSICKTEACNSANPLTTTTLSLMLFLTILYQVMG